MKQLLRFGMILAICIMGFSIEADAQVIIKVKPIKPTILIVKGKAPHGGMVWIAGGWTWNKRHKKYVWRKGHWVRAKRGRTWAKGYWVVTDGGHRWVAGRWKRIQDGLIIDY